MIAIPNMDKPKVCADCSVNDMVCGLWMEVANIKAHKHKDCPLIDIVTCGECKLMRRFYDNGGEVVICLWTNMATKPNRFCSEGERRE